MSLSITKQTNPQVPNLTYPPLPSWNIWPYPMPFTTRSWQWHQSFLPKKQMPSDGLKMYCMYLHCVLESGKQLRYKELRPVGSRYDCVLLFSASEFMLIKHWCGVKGRRVCVSLTSWLQHSYFLHCSSWCLFWVSHFFIWYRPLLL